MVIKLNLYHPKLVVAANVGVVEFLMEVGFENE